MQHVRHPLDGPRPLSASLVRPHPLRERFVVAAVTGTDGKTTTTTLIDAMVRASGQPCLRVTTLGAFLDGEQIEDAKGAGFDAALSAALERGVRTIALEVTSHALSDGFARRFPPDVAVLTSFTRDHLDHHKSPEHYLASKAQLFLSLRAKGTAVLPLELPASELILELLEDRPDLIIRRASIAGADAALCANSVTLTRSGLSVALGGSSPVRALGEIALPLRSTVHAQNLLGALLAAEAIGVPVDAMREGLAGFAGLPGRMEVVCERPLVSIDFAHTPGALEGTLRSARSMANDEGGRVIVVFGCGGGRDPGKRPEMGRIASELAHEVLLTTDNPRGEDPRAIADAVEAGRLGAARWTAIPDRGQAIERAIAMAHENDVVVIAGRGHERTQEIAGEHRPFSDADVAREACARR